MGVSGTSMKQGPHSGTTATRATPPTPLPTTEAVPRPLGLSSPQAAPHGPLLSTQPPLAQVRRVITMAAEPGTTQSLPALIIK